MRQGKTVLLVLTGVFLLTEMTFNYLVSIDGNGDVLGANAKTLIFLLFILLFTKKLNWAKWTLSILLTLYGMLCLVAGTEFGVIFYLIGLYDIFFGISLHKLNALRIFYKVESETESELHSDQENRKPTFIANGQEFRYPLLVKRYKALMIDGFLLLTVLIIIMIIVQDREGSSAIKVASFLILSLTYEPLLTAYSRTIGQKLMKIRVGQHGDPQKKISLLNAYLRWFVKGLLGWLSFITINFNREHRAIHDIASDAVMVSEE